MRAPCFTRRFNNQHGAASASASRSRGGNIGKSWTGTELTVASGGGSAQVGQGAFPRRRPPLEQLEPAAQI